MVYVCAVYGCLICMLYMYASCAHSLVLAMMVYELPEGVENGNASPPALYVALYVALL